MMTSHPTRDELELYAMGAREELPVEALEGHLAGCDVCSAVIAREARLELALLELARGTQVCAGCGCTARDGRCHQCGAVLRAGGFEVRKVLVQNAHGRLYLAEAPDGTRVALKELAFVQAPDAEAQARFEREANFLRALSHPMIPRFVASFKEGEGVHTRMFLAQEYVDGVSLEARLADHWFDEDEVVRIASQVLEVLVYLQSLSPMVFHGDIKPANLVRRPDGSIVLVDFGAARTLGATAGSTLVGTFGYMPVEQLAGTVDPTTDLYALGASLTHLLSRQEPWRLLEDAAFLSRVNASPALRRYLGKLMARRPADRFANARAALAGLDRLYDVVPRRRIWTTVARAATVALTIGGVAAGGMWITGLSHSLHLGRREARVQETEPPPPIPIPTAELSTSDCRYGLFDLNPKCRTAELAMLHRVDEAGSLVGYSFDKGFEHAGALPLPSAIGQIVQDPKSGVWYAIRDSIFGAVQLGREGASPEAVAFFDSLERAPAPTLIGPSAVAFDTKRRRVVVTADSDSSFASNEEGRQLFAYDPDRARWSLLGNLGGIELVAMAYLPADDLYYAVDSGGTLFRLSANGAVIDQRRLPAPLDSFEEIQLIADRDHLAVVVHHEEDDDDGDDEQDGNAAARIAKKIVAKVEKVDPFRCYLLDPRALKILKSVSCAP
jgi:hypothetical protein